MAEIIKFIVILAVFVIYFNLSFRQMDKVYYVTTKYICRSIFISDMIMMFAAVIWPITCIAYHFLTRREKRQRELNQLIKDIIL